MSTNAFMQGRNRRRGYTIVEALIAVLVMGVTGSALFGTLGSIKMIQNQTRRVNALNRVGNELIETLRDANYLTLSEALPPGDNYNIYHLAYYTSEEGQTVTLIESVVIEEMMMTCYEYRVQPHIKVEQLVDMLRVSVAFQDEQDRNRTIVRMMTEITENGINFR